ncbi:2-amino-4-hydroxy-6-hydroxymethyldihydropteridine diphosphokinase [Bacillus sp. PS06]|uniref:2-amino-4-hydroxy-6- hydroxymethyldihydropteridine diphosphokinase n=1 Tax=Bacillus sp. PS06 TaxID=2764176 RepID=UPI00399076A8
MNTAYISLGSNIGDRSHYLDEAVKFLQFEEHIEVVEVSSIYETAPVGYVEQDSFLNMVIKVNTSLTPLDLLKVIQEIENELGRKREIRWGPRTIDLDILLYNNENIETEKLIIPHPRMKERAFVLVPLMEIDESIVIPNIKMPISFFIKELQDREEVQLWKRKSGEGVSELFGS